MLTTDQKGAIAEAAITYAALKAGIEVYRPVGEGGRCDLILGFGDRLIRVQSKWAVRCGDVIAVRCYSSRRTNRGFLKRSYTRDEVDAFAAYSADLERCYLLPLELFENQRYIQLRLEPTRNNQRQGINWAENFEFPATLDRFGAIAQLGERRDGIAEVTGSSPVGST